MPDKVSIIEAALKTGEGLLIHAKRSLRSWRQVLL